MNISLPAKNINEYIIIIELIQLINKARIYRGGCFIVNCENSPQNPTGFIFLQNLVNTFSLAGGVRKVIIIQVKVVPPVTKNKLYGNSVLKNSFKI